MSNIKRIILGTLTTAIALGTTGCASTTLSKVNQAVPISYKASQGVTQLASLSQSYLPNAQKGRQTYVPQVQTQSFDQASVDSYLYKHQRVGKKYKIRGKSYTPKHEPNYDVSGIASWYGDKFHGKPTATGERFDKNDLTAAHKTLPLNSMLYVTNLETGKSLMVRLNDRGPFVGDRIIDLSEATARALGTYGQGLGRVRVQYAGPADPLASQGKRTPVRPAKPAPLNNYVQAKPAPAPKAAPYVPAPKVAPQAVTPMEQAPATDGQVTLTIKGPIHVANYTGPKPKLIRGVAPSR